MESAVNLPHSDKKIAAINSPLLLPSGGLVGRPGNEEPSVPSSQRHIRGPVPTPGVDAAQHIQGVQPCGSQIFKLGLQPGGQVFNLWTIYRSFNH